MGNNVQLTWVDGGLLVLAPAKINLSLLIGGKRSDGFHDIETVMAKVALYDELLFERSENKGIELVCKGKYWAPDGEDNLVYTACKLLFEVFSVKEKDDRIGGVKVTLTKNIPAGSGLGSASSDAAATLIGINKLFELGVSQEKLHELAGRLGSDVPFFLGGPLAFCWGRGEKIKEIDEKISFRALLALPDVNVSTKRVYENFSVDIELFDRLSSKINGYIEKNYIDLIGPMCINMLEKSCFDLYEQLAKLKNYIELLDFGDVCLSGSGSTVYCLLRDVGDEDVKHYQLMLKESFGCESLVVHRNRW